MPRKAKTTEEFQNELNEKYPDTYTIIGDYINAKTKVKIKYNKCGHENEVRPSNLLGGFGCPICQNLYRVTHDEFVEKIENRYPGRYEILGKYINHETPILVKYLECGHEKETTPSKVMSGKGCPICYNSEKLTNEEFLKRFYDLYGDEYIPLDEYKNAHQTMRIRHNICGTVFSRAIQTLLYKGNCLCPLCNPEVRIRPMTNVNDIHTLRPDLEEFLLSPQDAFKYTPNSGVKIWWLCPDCGHKFKRLVNNVSLRGFSCELCGNKTSYGERFIMAMLDSLNIKYEYQYIPKWVDLSRYDFMFCHNNIKYIIEVDGGFHYCDNNMSGQTAKDVIAKDMIKDDLAIQHGFTIIRLDYNYGSKNKRDYIINSIKNSILSNIFDLSGIDFDEIDKIASKSILLKVSDLWNSYEEKSLYQICKDLGISDYSARELLYKASAIGLIKESKEEIIELNRQHGYKMLGNIPNKVLCVETGEIFDSYSAADKKYHASITNYFRNGRKTSGHLPDGTRLTWQKIEEEKLVC